jgi:hypothetical protein
MQRLSHSSAQTCRDSDTHLLRHTETQTLRHSDTQTLRHSDTQTLRHSDTQTLRHTVRQSSAHPLRQSDSQTLICSDTQTLRHSSDLTGLEVLGDPEDQDNQEELLLLQVPQPLLLQPPITMTNLWAVSPRHMREIENSPEHFSTK